ncbi:MAG: response regulator, partial [Acidimicrobiales bacterium]|nr:response regulator [Acidimicrobiales bacterium]
MRVTIAEDSAVLREGLAGLLAERGFEVVAAVPDAVALRAAVEADVPDVAVVDIRMPPTHTDEGLRAAIELRQRFPQLAVLVFSQYVETRYAADLLADRSDGVAYLLKDRVGDVAELRRALDEVCAGRT